ncbi:MAG: type II toxin-antitoxin system VapC family toxin [Armatimonadota bacterium]
MRRAGRLSPRARRIFLLADEGREIIAIPSIVLVELIYLSERGIIPAALIDRLLAGLAGSPENYRVVPLDLDVVHHLRAIPVRSIPDMPDRIIAATAKATNSRLLSRDPALWRIHGLEVVW